MTRPALPIGPRLSLMATMLTLAIAAIGCVAASQSVQPSNVVSSGPTPTQVTSTLPTSTPDTSPSPFMGCLGPDPTLAAILTIDVGQRPACFGRSVLTFQAAAVATSVDCVPVQVAPAWLWCPATAYLASSATAQAGPGSDLVARAARSGRTDGPQTAFAANIPTLEVHAAPGSEVIGAQFVPGSIVRVTGHFDDPAAAACRVVAAQPGWQVPAPASVVLTCRAAFVVTALQPSSA